jgi:hypothetical protein
VPLQHELATGRGRRDGTAEPGASGSGASSQPVGRYRAGMVNLGTIPGDPDEIAISTTDPDKVTVWLGVAGATDLTRKQAEELAALLLRAVRELGG